MKIERKFAENTVDLKKYDACVLEYGNILIFQGADGHVRIDTGNFMSFGEEVFETVSEIEETFSQKVVKLIKNIKITIEEA